MPKPTIHIFRKQGVIGEAIKILSSRKDLDVLYVLHVEVHHMSSPWGNFKTRKRSALWTVCQDSRRKGTNMYEFLDLIKSGKPSANSLYENEWR
jgi:hypothetical protein